VSCSLSKSGNLRDFRFHTDDLSQDAVLRYLSEDSPQTVNNLAWDRFDKLTKIMGYLFPENDYYDKRSICIDDLYSHIVGNVQKLFEACDDVRKRLEAKQQENSNLMAKLKHLEQGLAVKVEILEKNFTQESSKKRERTKSPSISRGTHKERSSHPSQTAHAKKTNDLAADLLGHKKNLKKKSQISKPLQDLLLSGDVIRLRNERVSTESHTNGDKRWVTNAFDRPSREIGDYSTNQHYKKFRPRGNFHATFDVPEGFSHQTDANEVDGKSLSQIKPKHHKQNHLKNSSRQEDKQATTFDEGGSRDVAFDDPDAPQTPQRVDQSARKRRLGRSEVDARLRAADEPKKTSPENLLSAEQQAKRRRHPCQEKQAADSREAVVRRGRPDSPRSKTSRTKSIKISCLT